jgi:hypothetical protein
VEFGCKDKKKDGKTRLESIIFTIFAQNSSLNLTTHYETIVYPSPVIDGLSLGTGPESVPSFVGTPA